MNLNKSQPAELNCQNCNQDIVDNFCAKCGQKKYKRIDKKYVLDELQYTLVHTNKGFMYSVKSILRNPGKTAREFIYGNRVNHYKPIGLVFILAGISTFISFKIIGLDQMMKGAQMPGQNTQVMTEMMGFLQNYNSILMLIFIPILALLSKLSFGDWRNNYYEHTVMNAFGMAYYTIVTILFVYPIMYLFRNNPEISLKMSMYLMLTIPVMMVYFYKHFYHEKKLKTIIIRVLAKTALFAIVYIGVIIVCVIGMMIKYGPESFKTMAQPQ